MMLCDFFDNCCFKVFFRFCTDPQIWLVTDQKLGNIRGLPRHLLLFITHQKVFCVLESTAVDNVLGVFAVHEVMKINCSTLAYVS